MASDQPPHDRRDPLDEQIARAARATRRPVPAPGPNEPSDDELLRVVDGSASGDERARVEAAAQQSGYTRDRLHILKESLAETGLATGALERAARYVFVMAKDALELLRSATEPLVMPAPVAVRSGPAAQPTAGACYYEFVQPFGAVEAHLKIEHVTRANAPASIDVQVKLVGGGAGTRVSLLRAGQTVDSVPVGDGAAATFSGLAKDRYEIVVRRAGQDQPVGQVHLDFV